MLDNKNSSSEESSEIWNSEEFRSLRKDLVSGKRSPICENCWKLEEGGGFSYRQESIREFVIHSQWRDRLETYDAETGAVEEGPAQVEVRLSNLCNLTCRMCCPEYSSKWDSLVKNNQGLKRWHKREGQKPSEAHDGKILDFLERYKSSLKYVMFSGGEPLLQKGHYAALRTLAPFEQNITLEYTSNLNTLRDDESSVFDYWPKFKHIRMKVSLDADPEIYPFVRLGGSIDKVEKNIRTLQEWFPTENKFSLSSGFPEDKVILIGTCTVSLYNVARLPEIAKYFTQQGLIFHTSQVQLPTFQSSQALPPAIKEIITQKTEKFLDNLNAELDACWKANPFWVEKARDTQLYRVEKFVRNSIAFMNARDRSSDFKKLLRFEDDFGEAQSGADLFAIYPEWKSHV